MHQFKDYEKYYASSLVDIASGYLGEWVNIRTHNWNSLYVWCDASFYNAFGEVIGQREGDTIYLDNQSHCLHEDLFDELGHAVARKFDLIGHHDNGYIGSWQRRQARLIGRVQQHRHWSKYLQRVQCYAPLSDQILPVKSGPSFLSTGTCIHSDQKSSL